jgi:hypothetical protein
MTDETTKFWMCWAPSGHGPTKKHTSRIDAEAEAKRIAANPRQGHCGPVYILEAVGCARPIVPPVEVVDMKEGPGFVGTALTETADVVMAS